MFKLRLNNNRNVFFRGGMLLVSLLFPFIFSVLIFQIPIHFVWRLAISMFCFSLFFWDFCGVISEIYVNTYKLKIVTPLGIHVYQKRNISKIVYQFSKLSFYYSFTLKLKRGRRKTYHFLVLSRSGVPDFKIAEEVTEVLESIMCESDENWRRGQPLN